MATTCCSLICLRLFGRGADPQLTEPLRSADDLAEPSSAEGATASAPLAKVSSTSDADHLSEAVRLQLTKVLREVLETERAYVASLEALDSAFLPLLRPTLDSAGEELVTAARSLRGVHQELLQRLEQAGVADEWAVARAFALMTPFLRIYSSYCGGYARVLEQASSSRAALPALAELESLRGERIDSLLIRPVQRICKYPLFFKELLSALPANAGPRPELEAASEAMRKVNAEVNAKIKGAEDGTRLVALYHELGGKLPALLAPTRALELELDVKMAKAGPRLTARRKRYRLALLSDALVIARQKKAALTLRRALSSRRRDGAVPVSAGTPSAPAAPSLKLKAVLPLPAISLEFAGERARSGSSARRRPKSDRAPSSDGGAPAEPSAHLDLESLRPLVRYACKCEDATQAARLLEALASARAKLARATASSARRASLAPPPVERPGDEADVEDSEGSSGALESLVSTARPSASRRRSLSDALSGVRSSGRRGSADATSAKGQAKSRQPPSASRPAAGSAAGMAADRSGAPRGGAAAVEEDDEGEALGLYGLVVEEEAPGLYGIVYSSGEEEDSSDSSAPQSGASDWEDTN